MAKQRKQKSTSTSQSQSSSHSSSSLEEIPESEQWRIIEQTGVLKKIPRSDSQSGSQAPRQQQQQPTSRKLEGVEATDDNGEDEDDDPFSPFCNEVFNAICFTIPFSSLYVMMDVLAHRQYAQEITTKGLFEKIIWGVPFLFIFIFHTLRYKYDRRLQAVMFLLSVGCGSRLIYIVNWSSWTVVINQCAALGTIWVYTIVYLNLIPAITALALVAAYVKWKDLKIVF